MYASADPLLIPLGDQCLCLFAAYSKLMLPLICIVVSLLALCFGQYCNIVMSEFKSMYHPTLYWLRLPHCVDSLLFCARISSPFVTLKTYQKHSTYHVFPYCFTMYSVLYLGDLLVLLHSALNVSSPAVTKCSV